MQTSDWLIEIHGQSKVEESLVFNSELNRLNLDNSEKTEQRTKKKNLNIMLTF